MAKFQSAVIFVRDITTSRHFYETLLQQKVSMDHGLNVGFEAGFALWQQDHALSVIFPAGLPQQTSAPQPRLELYFETEQLDADWEMLAAAHTPVVHGILEQPWGQRVFRVYDPDQHIVELGEPLPFVIQRLRSQGLTVEEIAQRMSIPVEVIALMAG